MGLPQPRRGREGLRTFVLDPERNPGRANLFRLDGRIVVIDYAHNEAGMAGLTELLDGLRPRGSEVWVAICTAGDRTDEILHAFALRAAAGLGSPRDRRAPALPARVARARTSSISSGRARARRASTTCRSHEDELHALRAMLHGVAPAAT